MGEEESGMKAEERCLCGWEGVQEASVDLLGDRRRGGLWGAQDIGNWLGRGALAVLSTGPPSFWAEVLRACRSYNLGERGLRSFWESAQRLQTFSPEKYTLGPPQISQRISGCLWIWLGALHRL